MSNETVRRWTPASHNRVAGIPAAVQYDSVAFRFVAANQHPDHDTLATFRKLVLRDIAGPVRELLKLAGQMGMLKLGTYSTVADLA